MQVTRYLRPLLAGLLVIALLTVGAVTWRALDGDDTLEVTADFADTTGLYVGNEVDYLGVPVGESSRSRRPEPR